MTLLYKPRRSKQRGASDGQFWKTQARGSQQSMKPLLRHSGRLLAGIQFFELLDPGQSLSPQALGGEHAGVTGLRDFT
jgi:hypothetical protein